MRGCVVMKIPHYVFLFTYIFVFFFFFLSLLQPPLAVTCVSCNSTRQLSYYLFWHLIYDVFASPFWKHCDPNSSHFVRFACVFPQFRRFLCRKTFPISSIESRLLANGMRTKLIKANEKTMASTIVS